MIKSLNMLHVPIVFHDHYGSIETDRSVPLWMRLWAKYWVSHYVGVYSKLAGWAKAAGINPQRISVIDNALDLNRYLEAEPVDIRREFNLPGNVPVGIVIGGLRREKGIDVLLEALAQSAYPPAANILIVGGERDQAYVRHCRTRCEALGLNDSVIFTGNRLDVPGLLAGADFGIIASRSESGPLVLIEFLASGLPFVSTLVGSIAHRVSELGVPEFVDPEDPLGLAKAIDELLSLSTSQRRERGKRGQEIARCHFDISAQMSQWYQIYTAVLAGSN